MGLKLRDMYRGETEGAGEWNTEENVWIYMGGEELQSLYVSL
jgi:hypothetical protein